MKKFITLVSKWRKYFVSTIYATHNSSPQIKFALEKSLNQLQKGTIGLNIGAGSTRLHSSMLNIDLAPNSDIDCCALAEQLPFFQEAFVLIVSQETLEHVQYPYHAVREIYRVLKRDGVFYLQVPFIIGYHPGPTDFWRFSREGIRELVEQAGFHVEETGIAVGPGTGYYRILVEFLAITLSYPIPKLYHIIKGVSALVFFPIKWLDPFLVKSKQADRISGGYYVIASKP
jgi:SAM-dependent methyltransferase